MSENTTLQSEPPRAEEALPLVEKTPAADRIPFAGKLGYAFGGMAYNLMINGIGNLAMFVLNIGLGVNPVLVGLGLSLPRFYDAIADLAMGHISDNFRSRFGRRKPFMLVGGIGAGLAFAAIWFMPRGWSENAYFAYFLGSSLVFYTFLTLFGVPWSALGFSMTADYNERTRLMGFNTFLSSGILLVMPWLYALTKLPVFPDSLTGARIVGTFVGGLILLFSLLSTFLCPEKVTQEQMSAEKESLKTQLLGVLSNRPFMVLSAVVFTMCLGIFTISSITPYIMIYYVYGGNETAASVLIGMGGSAWQISSILFIPLVTLCATHFGKKRALILFLCGALFGSLVKWGCYNPAYPLLSLIPSVFVAMGFCALWILVSSMIADTCDFEELRSGARNEGILGAVYSWIMKLGGTLAFASSGLLLNLTGFQQALGGNQSPQTILNMRLLDIAIPALAIVCSILLAAIYPLTEHRSREIRKTLEDRRGTLEEIS